MHSPLLLSYTAGLCFKNHKRNLGNVVLTSAQQEDWIWSTMCEWVLQLVVLIRSRLGGARLYSTTVNKFLHSWERHLTQYSCRKNDALVIDVFHHFSSSLCLGWTVLLLLICSDTVISRNKSLCISVLQRALALKTWPPLAESGAVKSSRRAVAVLQAGPILKDYSLNLTDNKRLKLPIFAPSVNTAWASTDHKGSLNQDLCLVWYPSTAF